MSAPLCRISPRARRAAAGRSGMGGARSKSRQLQLHLPTWGGRRKRKRRRDSAAREKLRKVPQRRTRTLSPRHPVHVTWRVLPHVWNLRSRRCFSRISRCFSYGRDRFGFRLVHFSVQGNHLHLVVEAQDERALARGMQGLGVRIAKALNRLMGRKGTVFCGPLPCATAFRTRLRGMRRTCATRSARHGARPEPTHRSSPRGRGC